MTDLKNLSEVQILIEKELALDHEKDNNADWMNLLVQRINDLLLHDFDRLVSILYRLDVDESKFRVILKSQQPNTSAEEDTGLLISKLIIERQLQKLNTRNQYRSQDNSPDDNERW